MSHLTPPSHQTLNTNDNNQSLTQLLARLRAMNVHMEDVRDYAKQHRRFAHAAESTLTLVVERLSLLIPQLAPRREARPCPELAHRELQLIETQLNACGAAILQANINAELAIDNLETQSTELARFKAAALSLTAPTETS